MSRKGGYCVYILQCSDGTYYTGATNNLPKRLKAHNAGRGAKYLRGRLPVQIVFRKSYHDFKLALKAESLIKRQPRAYKEMLIKGGSSETSSCSGFSPRYNI